MASAESQPRFGQSVKGLLSDKVGSCSGDVIALTRQVLKGSRSQELLGQAARNMVIQEDAILHSEDVSSTGIQVHTTVAQLTATNCVHSALELILYNKTKTELMFVLQSLRKMSIITTHLQYQQEAIQKNVEHSKNLQDQLRHLLN
uniref:BLOC-1-related complex subunit 7 n=1 Tax=Hucho hucho TaxID=62062 RepID=A0A4W5R692_9TELE